MALPVPNPVGTGEERGRNDPCPPARGTVKGPHSSRDSRPLCRDPQPGGPACSLHSALASPQPTAPLQEVGASRDGGAGWSPRPRGCETLDCSLWLDPGASGPQTQHPHSSFTCKPWGGGPEDTPWRARKHCHCHKVTAGDPKAESECRPPLATGPRGQEGGTSSPSINRRTAEDPRAAHSPHSCRLLPLPPRAQVAGSSPRTCCDQA